MQFVLSANSFLENVANRPRNLATVGTILLAVLVLVLIVQHALNGTLDWNRVTYEFGDEIDQEPRSDNGRGFVTVDLRAHGNGATVRRGIVQYVAHHEGTVLRYGYVHKRGEEPSFLVRFFDEIGFSNKNKYDEPLLVQLAPAAAEDLVRGIDTAKGRSGMQRRLNSLPDTRLRPQEYTGALPSDWPIIKVWVEPSYGMVAMVLGSAVLGVLVLAAWAYVLLKPLAASDEQPELADQR